jgi:hypothetical protein
MEHYEALKQDVASVSGVSAVSSSDINPLRIGNNTGDVNWKGKEPNAAVLIDIMSVDYGYLDAIGIRLKEGRDFSKAFGTDSTNYIINEEAVRLMQMEEPAGESLSLWEREGRIIGLIKNFQSHRMQVSISPLIIRLEPRNSNYLFARVNAGKTTEVLASMEKIFQKYNPALPFEYHFLDDDFEQMYKTEAVIGKLTNYFAGIAIFISCLGLFGLALFTAEQRKKEIGIRKVLGASVSAIVFMLSKDFLKLVLLANVIALPLSWYFMSRWLEDYANRTDLSWWVFAAAFVSTILIAMFTLSFHAIKTAIANPVSSLRTE